MGENGGRADNRDAGVCLWMGVKSPVGVWLCGGRSARGMGRGNAFATLESF